MWNKIQRIYVGTNLVRPNYWEYNFVGKTIAEIQSDWWTWSLMQYYGIDQYWLYWSRASWILFPCPLDFSIAKKIIINTTGRIGSSGDQNHNLGIAVSATWTSSQEFQTTGFYTSYNSYWAFLLLWNKWTAFTSNTISWTNFAYTGEIDFVNKKISIQYTTGSTKSFNQTLTDAQITTIKTSKYIVAWLSSTTTPRISYIKVTVEY